MGSSSDEFPICEDGRPQEIAKFELVEDLPLTLGITIDTSGSMFESLGEAQRAAVGFLENIITPRDRCFALAFADKPALLMSAPPTSARWPSAGEPGGQRLDVAPRRHRHQPLLLPRRPRPPRPGAALGRRGHLELAGFDEALEYAKRSGVLGLHHRAQHRPGRRRCARKLEKLAEETGGRTFYIKEAAELRSVYNEIERELRSQYLVAYNSDQQSDPALYREVEVDVKGGYKARTIKGYYP